MNEGENSFLGEEPVGKLMRKYAIPCVISLLVGALYNIVDQIFIANASYLGSYGNAANKDKRRKAFYQLYTDLKWGDVRNYQIALDSGIIGIDKCADIICELYRG